MEPENSQEPQTPETQSPPAEQPSVPEQPAQPEPANPAPQQSQPDQSKPSKGYGKRPVWQWVLIYVVIAIIVYGLIYVIFIHKSGSKY